MPEGTSIMRAAMERGKHTPKLCATDMVEAFGSCRLCLVEIDRRNGTPASCTTPVAQGMVVKTQMTKTHSSSVSTFQSPQYGPIGIVTKSDIHFHHAPLSRTYLPIESINKKVAMFKIYAGMESDLLLSISFLGYDGVVLEGLGQGNVPPDLVVGIRRLLSEGLPVILVSRCFNGIAQDIYRTKAEERC